MRVVLDTNVLVRAVMSPQGPAGVLHALLLDPAHEMVTRDRHLHSPKVKDYCSQLGIRVVTDLELMDELRRE